ncbi:hypothetical protein ERO13_A05G360050v2 [Gossypium hirsutum]|nr:hypothetical protein ERO13_A05G360050v2 [Gossypium hirsutum]
MYFLFFIYSVNLAIKSHYLYLDFFNHSIHLRTHTKYERKYFKSKFKKKTGERS